MEDLNPELKSQAVAEGVELLERGVRDYSRWSRSMVYRFGEDIRPHLELIWTAAQDEGQKQKSAPAIFNSRQVSSRGPSELPRSMLIPVYSVIVVLILLSAWLAWRERLPSAAEALEELQARAEKGDVISQLELARRYSTGNGVALNREQSAEWFRRAANQGDPNAQFILGSVYEFGEGVPKDNVRATYWYQKAAEQGFTVSFAALQRMSNEMAKVLAEREAEQRAEDERIAKVAALRRETPLSRRITILSEIVSNYHAAHTYVGKDIFVCGDMASDVWNMVATKGIKARIVIGDVDRDITHGMFSNHAWVLAEVAPSKWLALESTAGVVVPASQNRRYYRGWSLSTPKELKTYSSLLPQYYATEAKFEKARQKLITTASRLRNATRDPDPAEWLDVGGRGGEVKALQNSLGEVTARIEALLSKRFEIPANQCVE